jgi:magnesium-transporting ATPase (P-type)
VPFALLKLRSKLTAPSSKQGVAKWACISGVAYMVYWWITYFGQWLASILQPSSYASTYPGYGMSFLLNYPINTFTFMLTAVGLPLLIVFFWWTSRPAIKDSSKEFSFRNVGIVLTLIGAYFITIAALFYHFGYVGGASIWIIFFMYNNPDLWCITLPLVGIPLILANPKIKLG